MSTSHDSDSSAVGATPTVRRPIRSAIVGLGLLAICIALGTAVAIGTVGATGLAPTPGIDAPTEPAVSTTEPGIVVSDATIEADPGTSAAETHRVALTDAPEGLAGFNLTLELASDDVATIANASYPDHFGMTTEPSVGADERTITLEAVDLEDAITDGATDVTLAEITVTGHDAGETELRITDVQVDADGGSAVEPSLEAGTVTVTEPAADGSGADSTTDPDPDSDAADDGEPDDGIADSVPGFTGSLALAALVATAAALVVRRD